jgi:hypothetical protein
LFINEVENPHKVASSARLLRYSDLGLTAVDEQFDTVDKA